MVAAAFAASGEVACTIANDMQHSTTLAVDWGLQKQMTSLLSQHDKATFPGTCAKFGDATALHAIVL